MVRISFLCNTKTLGIKALNLIYFFTDCFGRYEFGREKYSEVQWKK